MGEPFERGPILVRRSTILKENDFLEKRLLLMEPLFIKQASCYSGQNILCSGRRPGLGMVNCIKKILVFSSLRNLLFSEQQAGRQGNYFDKIP